MASEAPRPVIAAECLWTVRDVAAFLRLGRNAVYSMAASGALPSLRVGARVRFLPEEIRTWLARQRAPDAAVLPLPRQGG
jgi:excisionase family DNA binding protein